MMTTRLRLQRTIMVSLYIDRRAAAEMFRREGATEEGAGMGTVELSTGETVWVAATGTVRDDDNGEGASWHNVSVQVRYGQHHVAGDVSIADGRPCGDSPGAWVSRGIMMALADLSDRDLATVLGELAAIGAAAVE
jgi:hypothetical protein